MKYQKPENPNLSFILKPELMESLGDNPTVWDYMDENSSILPNDLIPLHLAALKTNEDTWAFINLCYGKFLESLKNLFETDEMQKAWGW